MYPQATLAATIGQQVNDITNGGKIILVTTIEAITSRSSNGSQLFIASECGKIEAGSPYDAGSKIAIIAADNESASGNWSIYPTVDRQNSKYFPPSKNQVDNGIAPEFVSCKEYFFDAVF